MLSRLKQAALGPKVNLWKAVKIAKDVCPSEIPQNLTLGGKSVEARNAAACFSKFVDDKIKLNLGKAKV